MHNRGIKIEREVKIDATNLDNKTFHLDPFISNEFPNSQRCDRFFMDFYKASVSSVRVLLHRWR
jgi:hypothetical protein